MSPVRRSVGVDERRARLAVNHRLSSSASDALEVTRSLVALHSSDPSTVYLSVWSRAPHVTQDGIAAALYEDRSLVRIYGMRRTLWVVDRETHPLVEHSSTSQLVPGERRRLARMLVEGGVTDDGERWMKEVEARTEQAVIAQGPVLARDLSKQIPELTEKLTFYNKRGDLLGTVGISTRMLVQLALESRIVRAQPVGTWISSQYRWVAMERWLGGPIPEMAPDRARARLIDAWLRAFGPATATDAKWWTGWTMTQTRQALAAVGAVECELDTGTGFLHPDRVEPPGAVEPWAALLPSLDATTMGWKERDWYLGEHSNALFDRNGNAGPTIWVTGRVVGGWAQRKTGEVVYELFDDVGADMRATIDGKVSDLQDWLGDAVVTPRFRSSHDRALTA